MTCERTVLYSHMFEQRKAKAADFCRKTLLRMFRGTAVDKMLISGPNLDMITKDPGANHATKDRRTSLGCAMIEPKAGKQMPKAVDFATDEDSLAVNDTFWGYVVGPSQSVRARARRAETMAVFGALFFCGIAFVPWVLPASQNSANAELLPFRIAVTAIFFAIGGLLYLMAKKGMTPETQVDLHEKEFRIVRRNRGQESVTLNAYSFDQVSDIVVARAPGNFMFANLCLQLNGGQISVVIATGPERLLADLKVKITSDMRPVEARTKRPEPFATTPRPSAARPSIFGGVVS